MDSKANYIIKQIIESRLNHSRNIQKYITDIQVQEILVEAYQIFQNEPVLIQVPRHVRVVGDIHGNIDDLLRIFQQHGYPPETRFLFLGDYVDRGQYSFEVVLLLFALKVKYPQHIFMLMGNHELHPTDFQDEIEMKYSRNLYKKFYNVFVQLPFIAKVGRKIVCVHGGIGPNIHSLEELSKLPKAFCMDQQTIELYLKDLLWNDPKDQKELFANNKQRNGGSYFNDVALHNFLKNNNLHVLIRGHEMAQNGIHFPFAKSNECITVFSSSKYNNNNQGAVLIIEGPEISSKKFMPLQDSSWKPTFPPWLIQEETRSSSDVSDDGISAMMEDFLVPNIFGLVQ